ncbi:MAG: membrane protein insertase YidC [Verrucomicrobia subdivision 3 bacterium]|nr:membrane protein insertase YidC [Limisphaerales bacterium]
MDRKSLFILFVCVGLFLLWPILVHKIFPPVPLPPGATNQLAGAANQVERGTNIPVLSAATNLLAPPPVMQPAAPEELQVIQTREARYTFTTHGGGLKHVELKEYLESVTCDNKKKSGPAALNKRGSVPALALLGDPSVQGDGVYKLAKTATGGVRAEKELPGGVVIINEFQPLSNFVFLATVRVENRGAQPVALPAHQLVVGTAAPVGLDEDPNYLGVYWYHNAEKKDRHVDQGYFANKTLGCIPGTPRTQYREAAPVGWAAAHDQFFTLALMPKEPAPEIVIVQTNLPPPTAEERAAFPRALAKPFGFQTSLGYPAMIVATNQPYVRTFELYAGPKEYQTLVKVGARLKNNVDLVMDYDGFFGWFAQVLLSSMNGLNKLGLPYWLAIISITVIIKLLFWPLTNASTKSMKRMAALQPQMKAIQERYKEDPAKMQRKMMEFMKEHKVNPMGGCLPVLLQMPVFFGFFLMIRSAIELRGAGFLWCCDLSKPDTVAYLPLLNFPINPLPLLMGVTMLWQARLTPAAPGMDPVQQKMMKYMPLMFLIFLYNFSAGLTLYWTVQNLLSIAQMKITKASEPAAAAPAAPARPAAPAAVAHPRKKK